LGPIVRKRVGREAGCKRGAGCKGVEGWGRRGWMTVGAG
jgi:hypothetical protein